MANLFIVYTPFQLMIAQEIIHQEKLENNIMVKGYVRNNTQFLQIYDYLQVDGMWNKEYIIPSISSSLDVDLHHPFQSMIRIRKNYKKLEKLIAQNKVDTLFLGNINNNSLRIMAKVYAEKKLKIAFFEEGAAHYTYQQICLLSHKLNIAKIYKWGFNLICYKPLFNQAIGEWQFERALQFEEIPISSRYNILQHYNEPFDKKLICTGAIGEKAKELVKKEISTIKSKNKILFLDQPVYEIVKGSVECYIETISSFLDTISKDTDIIIKYHPREIQSIKEKIERVVQSKGYKYTIIGNTINLPVELYLQLIPFKAVYNFYTSSSLYNGKLFPETIFHYLIENLYAKCQRDELSQSDQLLELVDLCRKIANKH